MFDFVCVGDATRDLFLFPENLTVADGKIILEHGSKIPVKDLAWSLGGNAANVSVGLSRLGLQSALVTVFGDDDRGAWIKRELLKNNVNLESSQTELGRQSNLSTILVVGDQRTIFSYHANGKSDIKEIPQATWLYATSSPGNNSQFLFQTVETYKQAHPEVKIAYNPYTADLKRGVEFLQPMLGVADVLLVNKEEKAMLGEIKMPKIVVVTDGPNGATVFSGIEPVSRPAIKVPVIEVTGAGDAFSSGFLAGLFKGKPPGEALDWGLKNSASVIQKIGAIDGLLTYEGLSK